MHPVLFKIGSFPVQSFGLMLLLGLGVAAVLVWAKRRKVALSAVTDLAAPAFLAAHAVGRIGCLLNGCCYGGECAPGAWYGVRMAETGKLHVPAQLFDSAMNVGAVLLLLAIERRRVAPLVLTGWALILHGAARFVYEFWRAGSSSTYLGSLPITEAQATALVVMIVGAVVLALGVRGKGGIRAATA